MTLSGFIWTVTHPALAKNQLLVRIWNLNKFGFEWDLNPCLQYFLRAVYTGTCLQYHICATSRWHYLYAIMYSNMYFKDWTSLIWLWWFGFMLIFSIWQAASKYVARFKSDPKMITNCHLCPSCLKKSHLFQKWSKVTEI